MESYFDGVVSTLYHYSELLYNYYIHVDFRPLNCTPEIGVNIIEVQRNLLKAR